MKLLRRNDINIVAAMDLTEGVHATGQVVSFHVAGGTCNILDTDFAGLMNDILPDFISIRNSIAVRLDFKPTEGSLLQNFSYIMTFGPFRPAIHRQYTWFTGKNLDPVKMEEASTLFVGTDISFSGFPIKKISHRPTNICSCQIGFLPGNMNKLVCNIQGKNMNDEIALAIISSLVAAGAHQLNLKDIQELLSNNFKLNDLKSIKLAPAKGLYLTEIVYANDPVTGEKNFVNMVPEESSIISSENLAYGLSHKKPKNN